MTAALSRREFLRSGALGFAGITAGVISLSGCLDVEDIPRPGADSDAGPKTAGFRWSIMGPGPASAYAYFRAVQDLVLNTVCIDAVLSPALPATAETVAKARCRAWLSRDPGAGIAGTGPDPGTAASGDFGAVAVYNPAHLTASFDPQPQNDVFYSSVLCAWVPTDGRNATATAHLLISPALQVAAGEYLIFSIAASGATRGVDVQSVLDYA